MSNKGGLQSTRATKGHESQARKTYTWLRDAIKENSTRSMEEVIPQIAGVQATSWGKYVTYGAVSEHVVQNMVTFSGLPREVFSAERPLNLQEQDKFKEKVRDRFYEIGIIEGILGITQPSEDINAMLRRIASLVTDPQSFNSVYELDGIIIRLEKLVDIAKSSKILLEKKLDF